MNKMISYDPFLAPIKTFTALTFELIKQREYDTLRVCFNFVERFLNSGDAVVKVALSSSFIPSLYDFLQDCDWKQDIVNLFPRKLRTAYSGQGSLYNIRNDYTHFTLHLN